MFTRSYFHIHILLQFSIQVFTKMSNGKYSASLFVLIKHITPKTYYYIAHFESMRARGTGFPMHLDCVMSLLQKQYGYKHRK